MSDWPRRLLRALARRCEPAPAANYSHGRLVHVTITENPRGCRTEYADGYVSEWREVRWRDSWGR